MTTDKDDRAADQAEPQPEATDIPPLVPGDLAAATVRAWVGLAAGDDRALAGAIAGRVAALEAELAGHRLLSL